MVDYETAPSDVAVARRSRNACRQDSSNGPIQAAVGA